MEEIATDDAPDAIGPYVQARKHDGFVECAGQIGLTREGDLVEGIEQQTAQALDNIEAVLDAADCGWRNVLKVRIYLADIDHYDTVNEVYADRIGGHAPARVVVEAAALPAGALIEIEATAVTTTDDD